MNSLRALSRRREALLHLVEGHRELADLVGRVDRDRGGEVAVGHLLGGLLEPAQAARVRTRHEPAGAQRREQRDRPRDEDLAPDQGDVVVDVVEAGRKDRDPARLALVEQRHRGLAEALAADRLDRARERPGDGGRRSGRVVGEDRRALELRVGDDEGGLGSGGPVAHAEHRHPRTRALVDPAHDRAQRRLGDPGVHRLPAAAGPASLATASRPAQLLGGEARVELRDDVEVDEPDRRGGDRRRRERRAGCGPSSRAHSSRKR